MFKAEDFGFVKDQIKHHQRQIDRAGREGKNDAMARHAGLANRFRDLEKKMQAANAAPAPPADRKSSAKQVGHRLGDLSDLPLEIRAQLVSAQYDEIETAILEVIDSHLDGIASIDEIFVALWRSNQQIREREFLARKIYRMTQKELLFSLQGKKGVYSTSPDAEAGENAEEQNEAGADLA